MIVGSVGRLNVTSAAIAACLGLTASTPALAQSPAYGTVIVFNDEWPLRNEGFANQPQSSNAFVANFCGQLDPTYGVSILVHSDYMASWEGETLRSRLAANGATVAINTNPDISLVELMAHDAVILCGGLTAGAPNNQTLIDYVHAGGNALFMGGTGDYGHDAQLFNVALNAFGLAFVASNNYINGTIGISSADPFFLGVQGLWQINGNNIVRHGEGFQTELLALMTPDQGLYAISRVPYSDCDADGRPDATEISDGSPDVNANGVPDACDCPGDLDASGTVDAEDLAYVLFAWGTDGGKTPEADIDRDGTVNANDLSVFLGSWGPCPN